MRVPEQALLHRAGYDRQDRDCTAGKDVRETEPNTMIALQMAQLMGYHTLQAPHPSRTPRMLHVPSRCHKVAYLMDNVCEVCVL